MENNDKWIMWAFVVAVVSGIICLAQLAVGIASWIGWKPQPNWLSQTRVSSYNLATYYRWFVLFCRYRYVLRTLSGASWCA
jgi:hypothetical protein